MSVAAATIPFRKICAVEDVPRNTGVCALVDGRQIAVFRVGEDDELYAIDNHDPFSGANVLSRGIVGAKGDVPKVASPIYKQQFSLLTGECFDAPETSVNVYPIREQDGEVYVSASPRREQ